MTFLTEKQQSMFKDKINEDFAQKLLQLKERIEVEFRFQFENSILKEDMQKVIDTYTNIPEIYPASIEEIEQARKKICDNMNR